MQALMPCFAVLLIVGGLLTLFTILDFCSGEPFERWVIYSVFGRWLK